MKVALETEDEIGEDLLTTASFERGYSVLGHQLNSVYLYRRMWAQSVSLENNFQIIIWSCLELIERAKMIIPSCGLSSALPSLAN